MALVELSKERYKDVLSQFSEVSFTQSLEMAALLQQRGFTVYLLGLEVDDHVPVAGILYSKPMLGGLRMEMNTGPASTDTSYLKAFYHQKRQEHV